MYRKLFLTFAYIGAFTFGGGYSMLPMFQRELVEKNGWVTEEEITDFFSICQCLPGIIAANTAVFVGYKHKGVLGGIVAALGVAMPSIVVIIVIAAFLTYFADIPAVQKAFVGIRVCVSVLIVNAVIKLRKHSIVDLPAVLIFMVVFLLSVLTGMHIALLVFAAGVSGIVISMIRKRMTSNCEPPDKGGTSNGDGEPSDIGGLK